MLSLLRPNDYEYSKLLEQEKNRETVVLYNIQKPIILCLHLPIINMYIGFSKNAFLSLTFLIYLFSFSALVCALHTITPSLLIQEPETISSNNSIFTLGFFRSENSTNRYFGIWLMTESTIVWVANRNNPLTDSSGVLTISENGNLLVLNGQKKVVWSTNVSHITANSSAQLLDSGNLVLVDGITGAMIWESFQHPCDTLLHDMKLSTNQRTGEKVQLTSWRSTSEPSSGEFSCSLEHLNFAQVFVWKDNRPYWRSGPWNGSDILGVPWRSSTLGNGLQVKEEEGTVEVSFHFTDKSLLMIYTIDSQGRLEQRGWNFQKNIREVGWVTGDFECDVYGKCGPFGICNKQSSPICSCLRGFEPNNKEEWARQNWTGGCVRREALQCERDNNNVSQGGQADGFLKVGKCLGCMFWNGDLVDLMSNSPAGVDLYLRLGSSELGTFFNSRNFINALD
ncbi:G-type lectin S-receptor-like serine/threonine-protein kinase At1g11330 [Neltuma alba]|uniref:G-type lectin S-receptor-like serine/threonine-protein kinase At1g11330 n=1 Tax=Neltuma alba TaxID=207710 RepID=UPI0010A4632A|nr:G-type lectin S-receptor-like serine/threonine-protein kinase At1g11330 [Prosopis alba]